MTFATLGIMSRPVAEHAGDHTYDELWQADGQTSADCGCGRWYSSAYWDREALQRAWLTHVAEALGICWDCGHNDDRSNRANCHRCTVLWWADQGVMPRDIPKDTQDTTHE